MSSILNGLFAARSGIASHGTAIGAIGDNLANSNTIGHKATRAEFTDLIAGSAQDVTVGVGSSITRTTYVFDQGTLELTGRDLDVAIDGNGLFVVQDEAGARSYTRAGNFKISADGFLVTQSGQKVLGFPVNGNGALQSLNLNSVSQDNVVTENMTLAGNLDARGTAVSIATVDALAIDVAGVGQTSTSTYAQLNALAEYSTAVDVFDSLGGPHTVTYFFFKTGSNAYTVRGYVNNEDVDATAGSTGLPRQLGGEVAMTFDSSGIRTNPPALGTSDVTFTTPWNNGSNNAGTINVSFDPFTQYSSSSTMKSITQDGQGVGNITSISVGKDGVVSSILDNGQQAQIGTIALANFANPEGLSRIGAQLLQKSTNSFSRVCGTLNS